MDIQERQILLTCTVDLRVTKICLAPQHRKRGGILYMDKSTENIWSWKMGLDIEMMRINPLSEKSHSSGIVLQKQPSEDFIRLLKAKHLQHMCVYTLGGCYPEYHDAAHTVACCPEKSTRTWRIRSSTIGATCIGTFLAYRVKQDTSGGGGAAADEARIWVGIQYAMSCEVLVFTDHVL